MNRSALGLAGALALVASTSHNEAHAQCAPGSSETIGWTSGIGFGAGAIGALATAGSLAELDDSRAFDFGLGLGAGIGASAALALVYAIVDSSAGCSMANDSSPIVWSVPIVTFIVGAALPVAIWGASDEADAPTSSEQALSPAASKQLVFRHSWTF